ncbi:MAG: ankyrin repeat domain-containing protein [Alphaproteobacteria bacterium]
MSIFEIIQAKDFNALQNLLNENPQSINERYMTNNLTVLQFAVIIGDEQILDFIISSLDKNKIDELDAENMTALHWAAKVGRYKILSELINKGANIEARDIFHLTPLHLAVSNDKQYSFESTKALLENKANIDAKAPDKTTPLHTAVVKRDKFLVQLLINYNADINAEDKNGNPPIYKAVYNADKEIIKLLKEKNANLSHKGSEEESLLHVVAAGYNDNFEQVKETILYLMDEGLNIKALDKKGLRPFHYTSKHSLREFIKDLANNPLKRDNSNFVDKVSQAPSSPTLH